MQNRSELAFVTGKRYQKIDVIASSNSATVVLSSDQSKSLAGFRATYQAVENIDRHVGNTI